MAESLVRSCIISCKGGVPIARINRDYKDIMGEDIPFQECGFSTLRQFLLSIEGVSIENGVVKATSAKTAHLEKLIKKQNDRKKRRTAVTKFKLAYRQAQTVPQQQSYQHYKSVPQPTFEEYSTRKTDYKCAAQCKPQIKEPVNWPPFNSARGYDNHCRNNIK